MDEVWTGSAKQKAKLRQKYGGKCAYCGGDLDRMHADHRDPVIRIDRDPWGKPLPAQDRRMIYGERNTVENMEPACAPCNLHKGGMKLEEWRATIARAGEILRRDKSLFRAAERFGVICDTGKPVTFYFER